MDTLCINKICKTYLERTTFPTFSGASDNAGRNILNRFARIQKPFSKTPLDLLRQ